MADHPVIIVQDNGQKYFHCPGCEFGHAFDDRWEWNGDVRRPTFSPSLLVTVRDYGPEHKTLKCHSFVTNGSIRFLKDCTHKLAGQTVPLEPIE